jgi:malonyl CoA-acyl carrier protein transacylase
MVAFLFNPAVETAMVAFLFPGQGSQKRGMGEGLFDSVREYTAVEREVDALLGYSMRRLCLEDPANRLKETQFTQPSLYVVNALYYYRSIQLGRSPSFVAGHSLGEYNALLAAEAFDFLTGLRLVKRRGELMASAKNGGMAAVIGLEPSCIAGTIKDNGLAGIDIATYNSPLQTVISGPIDEIKRAAPSFQKAGAQSYVLLQVSAPFHSRYMTDAARLFAEYLDQYSFATPKIPVIANATGRPYSFEDRGRSIKSLLVDQITKPVLWSQSVRYLLGKGITEFNEIGPGNVLTRLTDQIARGEMVHLSR